MVFDFLSRKKQVDVTPFIRRVIDLTTPNRPMPDDSRMELRYNRTMPVLLNPWRGKRAILDEVSIAFTRDLSDRGLGLIALTELRDSQYVITLWPRPDEFEEPLHLLATVQDLRPLSTGLWVMGFAFDDVLNGENRGNVPQLQDLAVKALLPVAGEAVH